ncbi:uncharacterized protein LOC100822402 [Brachypodium distachyon]|nr:uncharacterized protein LOC100822402 [Brachypodium distachyon]|eukprot:XP_010240324.1 uncharacterized protein LOC100822402 [Brachypodium distachyon]
MARSVACAFFFDAEPLREPEKHALDACALCAKPLARNSDIFMYKGDTPFCSEDCRYEQIEHDLACARQQASARRKQQQAQAQRTPAPAPAPRASAVSAKADVSVAS